MKKIILKTSSLGSYTFTGNTKEASFTPSADTDVSLYRIDDDYGKQVCLSAMGSNKIVKARLVLEGAGKKPANVPFAGKVNLSFISGNFSSADNVEKSLYEIYLSFAQWNEWEDKNLPIDVDTKESDWNVLYTGTRPLLVSEIEDNTEFNLVDIDVPSAIVGEELDVFVEMEVLVDKVVNYDDVYFPLAENTLRFQFSKKDYDPEDAGVGSAGTWTKLDKFEGVWDWTNTNTDWHESFMGAFPDEDNEVSVIAAGDTSDVTTIEKMFAGAFTNNPSKVNYSVTTRNNFVSCVPFDVSSCVDFDYAFCCTKLKDIVRFHYNNLLDSISSLFMFADTFIEYVYDLDFYDAKLDVQGLFAKVYSLRKASITGVENVKYFNEFFWSDKENDLEELKIQGVFDKCVSFSLVLQNNQKLKHSPKLKSNAVSVNCQGIYNQCFYIEDVDLEVNKANRVDYLFNGCKLLKSLPLIDTSNSTHFESMMSNCNNVETIPDYDVSSATTVQNMCRFMYKAKYGILEMYNKLLARGSAITNHTNCFKDCGRDTPEGRAALSQIPASWGGTGS